MKKYLFILTLAIASCTNEGTTATTEKDSTVKQDHPDTTTIKQEKKWKADEPTKQNVLSLSTIINDSSYNDPATRKDLSIKLQSGVDTLIKQCRMKGPDHDALHGWLEGFLKNMKELKEPDEDYNDIRGALKKDIEQFYVLFE